MSGETAAIGLGFLAAGPVGAIVGGATLPVLVAASIWRARRREDDANANDAATNGPNGTGDSRTGRDRNGTGSGGGRGTSNGSGGGRRTPDGAGGSGKGGSHKTPKGTGMGGAGKDTKKPKVKDPVADKLAKVGKGLADKLKNRDKNGLLGKDSKKGPLHKAGKDTAKGKAARDKAARDKAARDKAAKDAAGKSGKDKPANTKPDKGTTDGKGKRRKWLKDRGPQPDSTKPWVGQGTKPKDRKKKGSDDASSSTARDGLLPKSPKGGRGADTDEILDAELVDDDLPPKPAHAPDDVIDADVVDEDIADEDRIDFVRAKREKAKRRKAIKEGKEAADRAARDGDLGDPRKVKAQVIREANRRIDLEIHHENDRLALVAATEQRRIKPVNYPAIQAAPAGTRQAGAAVARQVDPRTSSAYAILRAMAEQLARGTAHDDDADMGDHIVELSGIPSMCKNLSKAVQAAAEALRRTAPLHPSVVKHLNNASVAARTAGVMSESIMVVFVQAHREDIFRVLEPRIGEERWNIRNAQGTLDAAKLRAAILSSQHRSTLPAGGSGQTAGGSKLVPASHGSTRKLISLMQGFTRGHMVNVLSEVHGAASGVEVVADSVGKLVRRMRKTWPTENIVDDTVARTEGQVRRVAVELRKAVRAANKAHARELRLNAKGRAGKGARAERKWDVLTRRSNG
ncbi:hypothetical protein [Streptomyces sp. NPDC018584]|uniref:hypothetical protein n=1 Tax=unclassified Streptomyces TaxID=2593676 RepID=UPI0037A4C81A